MSESEFDNIDSTCNDARSSRLTMAVLPFFRAMANGVQPCHTEFMLGWDDEASICVRVSACERRERLRQYVHVLQLNRSDEQERTHDD